MHILIGLFLIGVLINVIYGDFINAIFGFLVVIILYISSLFWDTLEKYGKAITVIISIGLLAGALKVMDIIEITPEQYQKVSEIKLMFPELNTKITKAIEDGEISIMENHEIDEKYKKLLKEKAINDIKK